MTMQSSMLRQILMMVTSLDNYKDIIIANPETHFLIGLSIDPKEYAPG